MKDPVKACEQIAATIGKDGVDALAASSGNSDVVTRRELAAEKAIAGLAELAAELRADGKTYGATQIEKMASQVSQWAVAV